MRLVLLSVFSLVSTAAANRTACFAYVDCFERAQVQLKECVGGTGVALTVEAKDQSWTAAELVQSRGLIFNQCQDHLNRELVDFDTLQLLVQEDARECFEKLPSNGKRVSLPSAGCGYSPVSLRDSYGKETNQCVTEYYEDRQVCEKLLDCCPDHVRCGERMNAVSVSYMHAKAKANQIISNMLKCVQSSDPTTAGDISLITSAKSIIRNPGLPFLRPDAPTEDRITRRLSLTSTATIEQRRQRFNRRYNQVRSLLSQRVHHVSESSRTITHTSTSQIPSERRISIIKNLLKNADDQELANYVSLIADGNFEKLSALEREKLNKMESEAQVDQEMGKMTKIRDAIKAALATKEQKTLNFLETSANQADRLSQRVEDDEWASEGPLTGFISKAMSEIDSDTLLRAKKFANALGEALQAQKELLLATKEVEKAKETREKEIQKEEEKEKEEVKPQASVFHGSGILNQRTSKKATPQADVETTTEAEETSEQTGTSVEPSTEATTPVPAAIGEAVAVRPLSEAKMVSIVQPHDGALETVKATEDAPTTEVLAQIEAEIERKGHKDEEKTEEAVGEIKGEDKRAVEEAVTEEKEEKVEEEKKDEKDGEDNKISAEEKVESTTAGEEITVATEATTEETKEEATTTKEPTTSEEISTTTEEVTTTTTELPATKVPLTEKSKKLMKKIMNDMKKKIDQMRKKVVKLVEKKKTTTTTTTTTEPTTTTTEAETTTAPEDRPSEEVEPLTESVEGSGLEVTTAEAETTTTTETVPTTQKTKLAAQTGPSFCASFANCDDLVRDYQEQCDRRFSPDVINHGIEDAEIVATLKNATISNNDIVLRACLRPLDKASYANLKQLLAIQRGVRRACLELGRNKNLLSEEETATCTSPLPSTEALDDFLTKTHSRSETTHTLCLAKLAPLRDTCQAVGGCCASINACDNYIASSPVRQLREEAQGVLIKRQHACEDRMLETLNYIQKRLTTRRRRV